ncbi:MAG: zinc-ribbon domain-containing protein [Firmicutes bacterium]|nr:zinc-ribbon domain-containing protein [Bacillota bacterium]
MYCRQCGTKLDDNVKFCGYCGTPVEQKAAPQPEVTPEPASFEPIVESEPIVEIEPIVEPEPIIEIEPVVEPEPIVEIEPVVELEPIVEIEPVVEPEPIVEIEPVVEPEPIVEIEPIAEPVADTEFVVVPEVYEEQPQVNWQEPVDDMAWQAPVNEEVWSEDAADTGWQDNTKPEQQWSDTWSETAQTSGFDWQTMPGTQVPLIIEPKKKNTGLKVFTIVGCVLLTVLIVLCVILMSSGGADDYYEDDLWVDDYYDEYEEELEEALEEFQEEYGEGAILDESIATESETVAAAEVTLSCGVTIPLDMTYVDLSGMVVSDLYGIEQCTQLQSLKVNGGSLTDLSPLVGLDQLNSLTLNNVPVSDIQVLKNLPNLTYLDITDTQVSPQQVQDLQAALPNIVLNGHIYSTYEVIKQDCTWSEAVELCAEKKGHLVTISDEEEMKKVEEALNGTDLKYLWMGGYSMDDTWFWITNEPWGGYVNWFPGEPSKQDTDGTLEDCLCLWNVDDNGWTMNDQRNDLPSFTSTQGRIGYICEYEAIAGYK